jgi:DNA-directed RNA polymerase subunit RPC12/RpoP
MATIAITCPKCEKQIKAPAELAGKKIRCKECQEVFVVRADDDASAVKGAKPGKSAKSKDQAPAKGGKAKEPAPAPAAATGDEESDGTKYGVAAEEFGVRCPYCAKELESDDQVICLHCGYNRVTRDRVGMKKTYETSGGDQFIWLLPGILCALGVLACIGIIIVFFVVFPDIESDHKDDWWVFSVGKPGRVLGTVLVATIGFFLGRFAVIRLIINNVPPEREKFK